MFLRRACGLLSAAAVIGSLAGLPPPVAGWDEQVCEPGASAEPPDGREIWRGADVLRLADIAALTAPVLWFAAEEPLLSPGRPPVPAAHPCDAAGGGPVVYYQAMRVARRGVDPAERPIQADPASLDVVERLVLRFYFYYPMDVGDSGHVHDLEGVDLEIALERLGTCRRVRIVRVEGLAHGNTWYSNVLRVRPDIELPVTVLVERGKHASAPDRNADGRFVRGDDVSERVHDAAGIRDLRDPRRARVAAFQLLPPDEPRLRLPQSSPALRGPGPLGRYTLRPAGRVPNCEIPVNGDYLEAMMEHHGFGDERWPVEEPPGRPLLRPRGPDQWLSLAVRGTASAIGAAVIVRGLDLRAGWVVPRLTVDGTAASIQALYTPSASRPVDPYVAGGVRRQFEATRESGPTWAAVIEGGVRARFEVPRTLRPFVFGINFWGARVGAQAVTGATDDRWQLVWELGVGAW